VNKSLVRFGAVVFSAAVILLLGAYLLHHWNDIPLPSFTIEIVLFFCFTTLYVFHRLDNAKKTESYDFIRLFMLSVVLKIIVSSILVFVFFWKDPKGANANALFFVINYLVFTGCEITVLTLKKNRE